MFKKITVLAMALGAMAGLALPASASAAWQDHQVPIQQNVQFGLTGNVRFETGLGGAECQFTIRALLQPGTTGVAETFTPHPTSETANCKGLGGYAFCQVHNLTPQAPNWTIHTGQAATTQVTVDGGGQVTITSGASHQDILITTQSITSQATGSFCPGSEATITPGTIAAFPNQPNTFSSVQLNGILATDKITNNGQKDSENVIISGTLQIEDPAQRSTYSI